MGEGREEGSEGSGEVGPPVVGLDLSLTGAGVCVVDARGRVIHSSKFGYGLKKTARVKDKVERMIEIAKGIVRVIDEYGLLKSEGSLTKQTYPQVAVEGYSFASKGNSSIDLGELGGVVKSQLWLRFGIEPVLVPVATGRKAVFGNGRTPKEHVIPLLHDQGIEFEDQDIADAYVVAETVRLRRSTPS